MKIWAQRGCSQRYPENTQIAFEKAMEIKGLEGIELDVQMTKDGDGAVIGMSVLQEQAVQMINGLSDENVSFLIEIARRLMPQKIYEAEDEPRNSEAMRAFHRLDAARAEIGQYLPSDFDLDRELEEARAERYGDIG